MNVSLILFMDVKAIYTMRKMRSHIFLILGMLICSCGPSKKITSESSDQFSQELQELQQYFHIPGLAALVLENGEIAYENYLGYADLEKQIPMDAETAIPMASLTKIFAATLIHQMVDEGKITLADPINLYLEEKPFGENISIAHVLSHTSQGNPGNNFYYSYRFGALTSVLEKASGMSYQHLFEQRILTHLSMEKSFLLSSEEDISERGVKVAKPYAWEGENKAGRYEYGFSTSAGLVSTLRDMAKFDQALDDNNMISAHAKSELFKALKANLPYAKGIFTTKLLEEEIYWGYGQYDHFSSLYLKIPSKKLTLFLAANNNLMSDPARLIYGELSYSLFALSFLKNFFLQDREMLLIEDAKSLEAKADLLPEQKMPFLRDKLLAQALAESFLARYEAQRFENSVNILQWVFENYPRIESYADLSLLHNLSFLKTVDYHMNSRDFKTFDDQLERIAKFLLKKDPENPYANYYLASYFDIKGKNEQARIYFQQILDVENFSPFWYTQEAKNWLNSQP